MLTGTIQLLAPVLFAGYYEYFNVFPVLSDIQEAKLTLITRIGGSDVPDYRSIGTSAYYTYVFLKPFYDKIRI